MKKIPAYIIFHHNLMYSSIPEKHYEYIINNVFFPILKLTDLGVKLGLEFNGWTLEKINEINPEYIKTLKKLKSQRLVEIIASSYTQAIFPLIPAKVNKKNIEFGIEVFKNLFGEVPKIFLLNEMVYSEGSIELLKNYGFQGFIFDWVNAAKDNNSQKKLKKWQPVKNKGLKVLWADTFMTQKFQRVVWKDIGFTDYFEFIEKQINKNPFAIPVYAGDAEVFEYIPGSLVFSKNGNDFRNMENILKTLIDEYNLEFVLPSNLLKNNTNNKQIKISSSSYPIKTKKQDKYNVVRWALTGRDAVKMNTQCYYLYNLIKDFDDEKLWKNLCFLWSSDFRTNTTDEKYLDFRNKMGFSVEKAKKLIKYKLKKVKEKPNTNFTTKEEGRYFYIETDFHKLVLIKNKGLALKELIIKKKSDKVLIGTLPHGYFEDISLGADFFSFHTIVVDKDGKQLTDLSCNVDVEVFQNSNNEIIIKNESPMEIENISLFKEYVLSDTLKVFYKMYFKDLYPVLIRLGIITFMPGSFDKKSLYYKTHNGGKLERYRIKKDIKMDEPVSFLVSSQNCLGATEGILEIGDNTKNIKIFTDKSMLYSIPLLRYKDLGGNKFFLRVYNSIAERSEVSNLFFKGYNEIFFEVR